MTADAGVADRRSLVYVADPMCSWCYGFGPELAAVRARLPEVPLLLVMGGLRAFNTQVMDAAMKSMLREHWQHVADQSGLPFNDALLARDDFIYDTEPACRAVVTARELAARSGTPDRSWPLLRRIQRAFYAEGRDITRPEELAACYEEALAGGDADTPAGAATTADAAFAAALDSAAMREATRGDFEIVQRWGIGGFPTLIAVSGEQASLVAAGYMKADRLLANVERAFAPAD